MGKKIVVALGGNAILTDDPTALGQQKVLKETAEKLVALVKQGHELVISHGNGPQVGNLLNQQMTADSEINPALPLDSCVAMTQGSIGFWLQNAMNEALKEENIDKQTASIITQCLVDKDDPAFMNPTKPVGPFLTEEEAKTVAEKDGSVYIEDAGRGWRKVVASPKPLEIIEYPIVENLVKNGFITISAGGGGIPVIKTEEGIKGVEAVIDKDFAAAKLAELVKADYLIILTGVDYVFINYGKENQKKLEDVTLTELKEYINQNQFAAGSMLPKVEAVVNFLENSPNAKAVITSLDNIANLKDELTGTVVKNNNYLENAI
ncbi:carbamate kinase [Cytobacillus solani]|uniref:Carbamate kinase n=1 Tax=Cytobacillus solani TaxID=1637975 RepID=A0A0Q3TDF8_9BACI|nr:carbamate kinase [Cytobacillus solani]KOP79940.1 carbamate kinase [Bacillus sp. FJAT-21945]KQL21173.1 carbamate kinase [Cytobacillus solani]USK54479.1 carbamate kinase [Cytobacillus solani]